MTLATLIKQWALNWAQVDPFATAELEERHALANDLGLTDAIMARIATLGPDSGTDLPVIIEAIFARIT
jgi:hypothetical protein